MASGSFNSVWQRCEYSAGPWLEPNRQRVTLSYLILLRLLCLVVFKGDARFIVNPASALKHGSMVRATFISYSCFDQTRHYCHLTGENHFPKVLRPQRSRSLFVVSSNLSEINMELRRSDNEFHVFSRTKQ